MKITKLSLLYVILLVNFTLILNTEDVCAFNVGYLAGLSREYTDNVQRERDDPESATINTVSGRFVFLERSESLDAYVDIGANKLDYESNSGEDRVDFLLTSNAEWRLVRDRLLIRYADYFTKTRIDSAANATPENQENVNVFSIGPELQLPVGRNNLFIAEYRYVNNYYEVSEADSDGSVGIVRFRHQSTPASSFSINYQESKLNYHNDETDLDYTAKSFFLGFERETGTNYLEMELGQSVLQREGSEDSTASTGVFSMERRVTPETRWSLDYARSYADSTDVISYTLGDQGEGITIDTEAGTVFLIDRVRLGINRVNLYGAQELYIYGAKIDYDNELYDRNLAGGRVNYLKNFSQGMSLDVNGEYQGVNFLEISRVDKIGSVGLTYNYEFQRNLFLRFSYLREARESTIPSEEFIENVYRLSIAFDTTDIADRILPRARIRTQRRNQTVDRRRENEAQN